MLLVDQEATRAERDLAYLLARFKAVLRSLDEPALLARLPWGGAGEQGPIAPERLAQLNALAFLLANLAEENAAVLERRRDEQAASDHGQEGLWRDVLLRLKAAGLSAEAIAAQLTRIGMRTEVNAVPLNVWLADWRAGLDGGGPALRGHVPVHRRP